jgi:cobalt-zinc-cadmium efflux system outer membrane protein
MKQPSLNFTLALSVAALFAGCAAPGNRTLLSGSHPQESEYKTAGDRGEEPAAQIYAAVPGPGGTLSLQEALELALMRNPELAAFSHGARAAEARLLQAGALPNPKLEIGVEEYDRADAEWESVETAIVIAQTFELGGKRQWRKRVAEAEGDLAEWDYQSKRLDLIAETARRFVEVLVFQERLKLARSTVELAQETSRAVDERVKAGKAAPPQLSKSEAELEMTRLDAQGAEAALGGARAKLAGMWGAEGVVFDKVAGSMDHVQEKVPPLETLREKLIMNPDLGRWNAELHLRRSVLASEKAARIPDLEASAGYNQFEEDGTDAFAFGVGIPLPVFDRNRGNITAAMHDLAKAEYEVSAVKVALEVELTATHKNLTAAHRRVVSLRSKVVPAMEQAYEGAKQGYREGKFGFLEMLDAQRGLFEARALALNAVKEYQIALINIQRLTSSGIDPPAAVESRIPF